MTTPTQSGNINLAMAAIMADIEAIGKTRKNEAQGFAFRGIEDVMNELHPIFSAHGVICVPILEKAEHRDAGVTKGGAVITRALITMNYRFTATDGSAMGARMIGEGLDSGDKATAKAVSMALKSLLTGVFMIPTADVVDADYYSPTVDAREELALKAKDKKAIEAIIAQRLEDAENATGERKKELLGLAAELRCKLAEIDGVTPTEVIPPEPQTKASRTPKKTATPAPADPEPTPQPTTPGQDASTPWREFVCHRGSLPGALNGNTLGHIFLEGRYAPKGDMKKLDILRESFVKMAVPSSSDPHDKVLWAKVNEAHEELKNAQGAHETPASTTATPKPAEASQPPALAQRWQDYVIPGKHPDYAGKTLGSLTPTALTQLHAEYLPQIDWSKATLEQKKLRAMVQMAIDGTGQAPTDLPRTANAAPPPHIEKLLGALRGNKWEPAVFLTVCKLNTWVEESHRSVNDITEDELISLTGEWDEVTKAMATAMQTAQQP